MNIYHNLAKNIEKIFYLTTSMCAEGVIRGELLNEPGGHLVVVVVSAKADSRLGQTNHQVFVVPLQSVLSESGRSSSVLTWWNCCAMQFLRHL